MKNSTSRLRQAERVPVKLTLTIDHETQDCVAESVDISETGILIDNYQGPALSVGKKVQALIKGIIGDDDVHEQLINMIVVRSDGGQVALIFGDEMPSAS